MSGTEVPDLRYFFHGVLRQMRTKHSLIAATLTVIAIATVTVLLIIGRSPQPKTVIDCSSRVHLVDLSPDGSQMATASDDGISLWSVATGQRIHDFNELIADAYCVNFSPDGSLIASGDGGGTVHLLQVCDSGDRWVFKGHTEIVERVRFSPGGEHLVSTSDDGVVVLWDIGKKQEIRRFKCKSPYVRFSPTAGTIAITDDGDVKIVELQKEEPTQVLSGHTRWISDLRFSPDGTRLATASDDDTARIWNPSTGHCHAIVRHPDRVVRVAFSSDGKLVAAASLDGTVTITDSDSGETIMRHRLGASALAIAFTSDREVVVASREFIEAPAWADIPVIGEFLYRGDQIARTEGRIVKIDVALSQVSSSQEWRQDGIASPAIHYGHPNLVLTIGKEGKIKIWEVPAATR